jgi:hypothetical protein
MQVRIFTLGSLLALGACAPNTFTDRPARLDFLKSNTSALGSEEDTKEKYRGLSSPEQRRAYRDRIVWTLIGADDDSFNAFVRRVRSDRALMNMSSDGGVIFLNGLAATLGTAAEKAALSTLSAGLLSSRGSVDKQLFNMEAMSALLARMKAARIAALVPIRTGLRQADQAYPLEQALVDLRAYADAGSLLSTITAITDDAGALVEQSRDAIKPQIRGEAYFSSLEARETLAARIDGLSGNQLTALVFALERYRVMLPPDLIDELRLTDPSDARFRDPVRAKSFIETWLVDGTDAGGPEWSEAVTLAEKAKP